MAVNPILSILSSRIFRSSLFSTLLFALLAASSAAQAPTPDEAITLQQQGRLPEAEAVWKAWLQLHPEDAGALAQELRHDMQHLFSALSSKPAEFYAGEITRMDGQRVTRLEMLQLIKEHELTHRQQLFMYLRLNGVVPPTTRRRVAKAKA